MNNKFKIGDDVRLIDDYGSFIKSGALATVTGYRPYGVKDWLHVKWKEEVKKSLRDGGWYQSMFELTKAREWDDDENLCDR